MTDADPSAKAPYQEAFESTRPAEIAPLIGKHLIYRYANGWQYELYIKNERTLDYRVHDGPAAGRWVTDQEAHIVRLAESVYKWSWEEPTGTIVSVAVNLDRRILHGSVFFPAWVTENYRKTAVHQNEHLDEMRQARDAGPTYPRLMFDEFAEIAFVEDCGRDNSEVIACDPEQLPAGYVSRRN